MKLCNCFLTLAGALFIKVSVADLPTASPGILCTPGSQTTQGALHVTQGGNVRFAEGKTGTIYLFCRDSTRLGLPGSPWLVALLKDEDGHGENEIIVDWRELDWLTSRPRTLVGAHIESNSDCKDTGEWQICRVRIGEIPATGEAFFQITMHRSNASSNVLFGMVVREY